MLASIGTEASTDEGEAEIIRTEINEEGKLETAVSEGVRER